MRKSNFLREYIETKKLRKHIAHYYGISELSAIFIILKIHEIVKEKAFIDCLYENMCEKKGQ